MRRSLRVWCSLGRHFGAVREHDACLFLEHVRNDLVISESVGSLCVDLILVQLSTWCAYCPGRVGRDEDFWPLKELLTPTLVRASTSLVTAG
jgi:hypothetical protein